jgi:hypothetical protein
MFEFSKLLPMLNQIMDGLRCFGTHDLVKDYPNLLEPVFVEYGCFLLKPEEFLAGVTGKFSEVGSNNREREIDIFKYFSDYVEDIECDDTGNLL